jgi:hypothetical protein
MLGAEEYAEALRAIDEAERIYREAMDNGGEQETWRAAVRVQALLGLGRIEEALKLAEWSTETAKQRGMLWSLPLNLQALALSRAAAGEDGVDEAFAEAAQVAKDTGALLSLQGIEESRDELGAGAR